MSGFAYQGPELLRERVAAALQNVVDPEIALSIVDVGLVYGVTVDDEQTTVKMTMTSQACPVTETIVDDVEWELGRVLPDGSAVEVLLCWDPPWTPGMMSERARRFMAW